MYAIRSYYEREKGGDVDILDRLERASQARPPRAAEASAPAPARQRPEPAAPQQRPVRAAQEPEAAPQKAKDDGFYDLKTRIHDRLLDRNNFV